MNPVITTVGVGQKYAGYAKGLGDSLDAVGYSGAFVAFTEDWPPGSPTHLDQNYGFKCFAIKECVRLGYDTIVYLDSDTMACKSVDPVFTLIDRMGYYLFAGTEPLGEWTCDKALEYYGYTRDDMMYEYLFGGKMYGISTKSKVAMDFLERWIELATSGWFYGENINCDPTVMRSLKVRPATQREQFSADPRCKGHRSDESMLALEAVKRGMRIYPMGHFYNSSVSIFKSLSCYNG